MKALVSHGAPVNAQNQPGQTALIGAVIRKQTSVIAYLLANGAQPVASVLLASGASPDLPSRRGYSPLHLATMTGNNKVIHILLANGAKLDFTCCCGLTALHVAVLREKEETIPVLLAYGARIDALSYNLNTPAKLARGIGNQIIVKMLTDHQAIYQPRGLAIICRTLIRSRLIARMHISGQPLTSTAGNLHCLPTSMRAYLYTPLTL